MSATTPTPSDFLDGCVVVLSGTFERTHADLAKTIEDLGGEVRRTVTSETTHLVASLGRGATPSKLSAARERPKLSIVGIQWLLDSIELGAQCVEKLYPPQARATADSRSKKRARSPDSPAVEGRSDKRLKRAWYGEHLIEGMLARDSEQDGPKILPDKDFKDQGSWMVWTDPDGVVLDAFLNQFTAYSDRRMKGRFNRLQLLKKRGELQYYTWSCRGSYGHTVERTLLGDGTLETALVLFQENFNAGTESNWLERKHWVSSGSQYPYTIIQQCHLEDGRPGLSHSDGLLWEILGPSNNVLGPCEELPKRVQELVRFILTTSHSEKTLLEMGYDATRLPPERLAWSTLTSAFEQLKTLRDMLHDSNVLQKSDCGFQYWALQWTEQFYTYIPPILRASPMPVINNGPKLKDAIELLERLSGLKMANSLLYDVKAAPGSQDEMYRLFEYLNLKEVTALHQWSDEFQRIKEYLLRSRGPTHKYRYELQEIFRIRRPHEWPLPIPSDGVRNPRLLWHGTRRENLPNVLSKGLSLSPPVDTPVHGQPMLGKAIYFSDVSSKAAQYCRAETSDDTVLLLLSEVELGLIIEPLDQDTIGDYSRAWRTDYCMWGKGRNREDDLKDASCIHPDLEGVQMPKCETGPIPHADGNPVFRLKYNEFAVHDTRAVHFRYLVLTRYIPTA